MTLTRAAAYITGGALLVAYLAAANSSPSQEFFRTRERAAQPPAPPDRLAREVQAQSTRLRERLASAPVPDLSARNPFSFTARTPRVGHQTSPPAGSGLTAAEAAPVPAVPQLSLMGIAEETLPSGLRRTAIIGGAGDALFIVTEGQTVADRYKVTTIGTDAIELIDLQSGGYRRLAMR